jgi:hypothetical protein
LIIPKVLKKENFTMTQIQDIVPVNFKSNQVIQNETIQSHSTKPKVTLRLKRDGLDITF